MIPEGADEEIEVQSNYDWTAKSNADWCKLSVQSGSEGKSSFVIKVEKNERIEERVAEVTVTAGSVVRTIKVVQLNPDGFEIIDLPDAVTVDGLESVLELQVKTNLQLEAISPDGWAILLNNNIVSGNPPKVTVIRIMLKDNTTGAPRSTIVK